MNPDKKAKAEFKAKASKKPDAYYATGVLKERGFSRKRCACGMFFWTVNLDQKTCDDPACSGGFRFFDGTPAKKELDYIGVWTAFAKHFKKLGYTPIERYPVVARWRTDTDFVQASIYDFQPFVVSGEVKPPANPLVIPQFCLRFNDTDNVGITGAHYTGFVMIGQHAFEPPERYTQEKYFSDIHSWLTGGLCLPDKEVTFHEDAWAGGGNLGPCMEFYSRGLELGNQVYMLYEQTPSGYKELNLKVLDMGMGHERNAWFTKGSSTSYETTFPTVCRHLLGKAGIKIDAKLMRKFLPYSAYLNIDEVEDINAAWEFVAKKVDMPADGLRDTVQPLAALFSVAEHSRSLLVALSDGALPSNTGGGYNLRVILRRALAFIDKYGWDMYLPEICEEHARYLKKIFPELSEHLEEVKTILDVERDKYESTKQKTRQIVSNLISSGSAITDETLLELYDTRGIAPELVRAAAEKQGKRIKVPEDFCARVSERHERAEQEHQTVRKESMDLLGIEETKAMYYDDYKTVTFKAKIVKMEGDKVILGHTYFYPTSGGQVHDEGFIQGNKVVDVYKHGAHIVHVIETHGCRMLEGEEVECEIDWKRRRQLAIHHTATHIINAAAKKVLGNHVNQAGAKKTVEKAHIDITHYQALSDDELTQIEEEADKVVKKRIETRLRFVPRDEAERLFGMEIYQGGVVPGKLLRIVEIPGVDVECCGGTHLHNTGEVGEIKIVKSSKISDAIVRITFAAGDAAKTEEKEEEAIVDVVANMLGCEPSQIPGRAEELFSLWKKAVKKKKKVESIELTSTGEFDGDVLAKTAEILRTPPEHIPNTIDRFIKDLQEAFEKQKT